MHRVISVSLAVLLCLMLAMSAFAATNARLGIVSGEDVVLREGPSTESERITLLAKHTRLAIIGSSGSFYKVKYHGKVGYITDEFLAVKDYEEKILTADVNLREDSTTDSDRTDVLPKGTIVNVFYTKDGFCYVGVGERLGYIAEEYVSSIKTNRAASSEEADELAEAYLAVVTPPQFTAEELYLAAQLVDAEAGNEEPEGVDAVASVLLNRILSPKYPNTVSEVVFQSGQFSVVRDESFLETVPNQKSLDAVQKVFIEGHTTLPSDVLYFKSARLSKEWGVREYYATIQGHRFYR